MNRSRSQTIQRGKDDLVIDLCQGYQLPRVHVTGNSPLDSHGKKMSHFKVNRHQPRSARLRLIQKIPTPIKLLISVLPEMINQICKKYGLENSQDKKTSADTCDIFQK